VNLLEDISTEVEQITESVRFRAPRPNEVMRNYDWVTDHDVHEIVSMETGQDALIGALWSSDVGENTVAMVFKDGASWYYTGRDDSERNLKRVYQSLRDLLQEPDYEKDKFIRNMKLLKFEYVTGF